VIEKLALPPSPVIKATKTKLFFLLVKALGTFLRHSLLFYDLFLPPPPPPTLFFSLLIFSSIELFMMKKTQNSL
jgi:hypothetical protein